MSREADLERMNKASNALTRKLATDARAAGGSCDLDDYPVRAEWSYLRSRATPERQFQMYIDATFSLTGSEDGPHIVSTALVASGRTPVECLEMFHNWATDAAKDPNVIAVFRDKVLRGEQAARDDAKDALERAKDIAGASANAKSVKERTQEWLAKKLDFKLRRDGALTRKVQL